MAVAFDAAGPSSAGTGFTTSPGTWTHVNGGNGILVGVTTFTGGSNVVTGVTYGGITVPFLGFIPANNSTAGGVALYGLVGGTCPTGSNTVSVSVSDSNNHNAGSVSVSGAGSLGTVVTNFTSGSGVSASFGSTTNGSLIVSAACQGSGGGFTATSPNVKRVEHLGTSNSGADNLAMGTDPGTGSAVAPAWTIAASDFWGIVAVEVLPPPAAVPVGRARPGKTWLRRFSHPQMPPVPPPPPAPPPAPAGQQPHGYGSSRRFSGGIWGGVASPFLPGPAGTAPDHLVIARRTAARAFVRGYVSSTVNASGAQGVNGTAPDHLVIARRSAARALIRGGAVPFQYAAPVTDGLIRRRAGARGLWRGFVSSTTNLQNGSAPDHLVIARRSAARAVWRGFISSTTNLQNGTAPAHLVIARRAAARAVWRGWVSATTNLQPGQVQPPATRQPRRAPARAVWRGWVSSTTNLRNGTPPVHLVVARRTAARVVWRSGTGIAFPAGTAPSRLTVARRAAARAVWAGVTVRTVNAAPTAPVTGTAPDHLVIARRSASRAVTRGYISSTANAPALATGTPPAHLVIGRRTAARAFVRGATARTTNLPYGAQPGGIVRRRAPARALSHGGAGIAFPNGTAPSRPPVSRRCAARAVWAGVTARTVNAVPPAPARSTGPHLVIARRAGTRGLWHGTVTRTVNAPPVSGTAPAHLVIARRQAARGVWRHSAEGASRGTLPPLIQPPGTLLITPSGAAGATLTIRRRRGQLLVSPPPELTVRPPGPERIGGS